jgi:hypothetical protein
MASLPVCSPPATSFGSATPPAREGSCLLQRLLDGVIALVMALVAQLLIAAIQLGLDQENSDFPAPIVAMAAVFLVFSVCGCAVPGLEDFYKKRLRRAVSEMPGLLLRVC